MNKLFVKYSDFGAKGDGITCDFFAIRAAHEYANSCGAKVLGSAGDVYYISPENFEEPILINTDVDFCGASFIIDDRGQTAFERREIALFNLRHESDIINLCEDDLSRIAKNCAEENLKVISGSSKKLEWLKPYINEKSLVTLINNDHKDYIRYGGNQNAGRPRHEILIVDKDCNIDKSTPVFFDYEKLTEVIIYPSNDKYITIENGTFYTICARAELVNRGGITEYLPFSRGFSIQRSNVTVKNIIHGIADQPTLTSNFDDRNGSYPYGGFLSIRNTYNLTVENCVFAGHVTYYEKKAATATMNQNGNYNYIAAGSYDFIIGNSTNINFIGSTQKNIPYTLDEKTHKIEVLPQKEEPSEDNYFGIGDTKYWGVMCSSFVRNLKFEDCSISRIDAHEGFFNVDVKNTVIGHTFHAIGGGNINLDGMTRVAGNSYIIARGDYGGSIKGTLSIKDGKLLGYRTYNSSPWFDGPHSFEEAQNHYEQGFILNTDYIQSAKTKEELIRYWTWNFGYDCHMPSVVNLIGSFTSPVKNLYIFAKDYHNLCTDFVPEYTKINPHYKPYELTKEINYYNWKDEKITLNRNVDVMGDDDYMYSHIKISLKNSSGFEL